MSLFSQSNKMRFVVHHPFGHAPAANDKFFIWKSALAATAPIRLFKERLATVLFDFQMLHKDLGKLFFLSDFFHFILSGSNPV